MVERSLSMREARGSIPRLSILLIPIEFLNENQTKNFELRMIQGLSRHRVSRGFSAVVARPLCMRKAVGSNPTSSILKFLLKQDREDINTCILSLEYQANCDKYFAFTIFRRVAFRGYKCAYSTYKVSEVAQWERAGLITLRPLDRNQPSLPRDSVSFC